MIVYEVDKMFEPKTKMSQISNYNIYFSAYPRRSHKFPSVNSENGPRSHKVFLLERQATLPQHQ